MADNLVSEVGAGLADKLFSGLLWFGVAFIIIMVLGFLMWYYLFYKKRFDIRIKMLSERAGMDNMEILDKAAILNDRKEGTPYLRIWNLKRDFVVPKYNVIRQLYEGKKSMDYIEIYRKGENEFYFLLPPSIDSRKIIKGDGKSYLLAEQKQLMMDPEMAFWAVKRKTLNKKMIDTEGLLFKLLPFLGILLGGVILIFILYLLLDHLPGILSELRALVAEMRLMQRAEVVTITPAFIMLMLKGKGGNK